VRIVKRGKVPEDRPWRGTCTTCRSVLEAVRGELKVEYDQREDGEWAAGNCPVCGRVVNFYEVNDKRGS
jgi:rRNA maturation endonuclease Nob1